MLKYREIPAPDDLSYLIFLFWEFVVNETGDPIEHEIFPDGCVSFLYNRNESLGYERLLTAGIRTTALKVPLRPGDVFWGVRVAPAACAHVLGGDPRSFSGTNFKIPDKLVNLGGRGLEDFSSARTLEQAASVFADSFRGLEIRRSDIDAEVERAVEMIEAAGGSVRIGDLAKELGLSMRHLQRRFAAATGFTPKSYSRIRRLYRTATRLLAGGVSMADEAVGVGFADQAHLSREVVALTGRSPSSFTKRLRKIDHGDLAK